MQMTSVCGTLLSLTRDSCWLLDLRVVRYGNGLVSGIRNCKVCSAGLMKGVLAFRRRRRVESQTDMLARARASLEASSWGRTSRPGRAGQGFQDIIIYSATTRD